MDQYKKLKVEIEDKRVNGRMLKYAFLSGVSNCLIDVTHASKAVHYAKPFSDDEDEVIRIAQHYYNGIKAGIKGSQLID